MQKILFYDIQWSKSNKKLPTKILAKDIPHSILVENCLRRFDPNRDSANFLKNTKGVAPLKFKWKRKDCSWYSYKFKKEETVFCPFLNCSVKIINHSYLPIWIGEIDQDLATDFWKENWKTCGLPKKEVIKSGYPWNFRSLSDAKLEKFGISYLGDSVFTWTFSHNGQFYEVTKNGYLKNKEAAPSWDTKKPFVSKIKGE